MASPEGKWIEGLSASLPAVDAARKVLAARLSAVEHYLPLAARRPHEDVEYVHQLRVSTRRAGAALDIFEVFIQRKALKQLRKRLRRVRRAAAQARDTDVFLARLGRLVTEAPSETTGFHHFLAGELLSHRLKAQKRLSQVADEPWCTSTALAAIGETWDFDIPRRFGRLAARQINERLREFDESLAATTREAAALHEIRIRSKQLRYAMEVFAPCFANSFREELYPAVEELQEILGDFNDCHVLGQRLEALRPGLELLPDSLSRIYEAGLEALAASLERRKEEILTEFDMWVPSWSELRRRTPEWEPLEG